MAAWTLPLQPPVWHNPENELLTAESAHSVLGISPRPRGARLELYRKSFVHSSYCKSAHVATPSEANGPGIIIPLGRESYERLEFLGDSVLDVIVSEYLFARYPDEDEGFLTVMRSRIVNGRMLAKLGRRLGLQRFTLLSSSFEHLRDADNVVEDVFEAFVAARFLDKGLPAVKRWFVELVESCTDFALLNEQCSYKDMVVRLYRERFGCDLSFASTPSPDGHGVKIYEKRAMTLIAEAFGPTKARAMDDACRRVLELHLDGTAALRL